MKKLTLVFGLLMISTVSFGQSHHYGLEERLTKIETRLTLLESVPQQPTPTYIECTCIYLDGSGNDVVSGRNAYEAGTACKALSQYGLQRKLGKCTYY